MLRIFTKVFRQTQARCNILASVPLWHSPKPVYLETGLSRMIIFKNKTLFFQAMELPKRYNAEESEKKWIEAWEKENIYKFDAKSQKPIFSIDVPPPYASAGHLHIGHVLH